MADAQAPRFDQTALHAAAQTLLATEGLAIPDHHGFVSLIDERGAQVAIGTRLGNGWRLDAGGGYTWAEKDKGWSGRLSIGKTWS